MKYNEVKCSIYLFYILEHRIPPKKRYNLYKLLYTSIKPV